MSTPILKRIFYQSYFKLYSPVRISTNSVSITQKLFTKKKFAKNKFTFQNEFQRALTDTLHSEPRIVSSGLHSEQNKQEYDDLSFSGHKIISSDLLTEGSTYKHQKIKFPQKKEKSKPSLMYQGEILYGVHPVYLALLQKKRIFHHLYTREEEIDSFDVPNVSQRLEIIRLAESMNIPLSFINTRGLKILAPGAVHQGICLDAGFLPLPTWNEDQFKNDACERNPLWLVLDEIVDPMNVGAIIRSAHYFGVNKLFTVKGNSCKLSPTVSKASSGSLEVMSIYQIDNLEDFIKKRKDVGWSIVSTLAYSKDKSKSQEPPISIADVNTSKPTVLILGNEGRGISQAILQLCDSLISIEPGLILPKGIDSLNVSVAAGVLLYVLNSKNIKR